MAKENLDELNKAIISDINKEQKLDELSKYTEKKPAFSLLRKKAKVQEFKPLPELKIPAPSEPDSILKKGRNDETKISGIYDKRLSIQGSMEKCRALVKQGRIEEAKQGFNDIRAEFLKTPFAKAEKNMLLQQMNQLQIEIKKGVQESKIVKKDVFEPKKERKGLFGFGRREPRLPPLKPIGLKIPTERTEKTFEPRNEFKAREPLFPEKPFAEEEYMPPALRTEQKLKEEGLIKSDFSLKELPVGEKEVKPARKKAKKAKFKKQTSRKAARKAKARRLKPITKDELNMEEKLLKKEERLLEKSMKEKIGKRKITNKEKLIKEKENFIADKLISIRAKEARLEGLRKTLEKKDSALQVKEKELEVQKKKYGELVKQIEIIRKNAKEEIKKQKAELDKREKETANRENYLRKKEKEVDIEDRAVDYAMSEFEKEKMKLEDDEFHAYLRSKVSELHGGPAPKSPVTINDIRKTESLKIPDLSDRRLSIQESVDKCKDLVRQGKVEQAKFMYNNIRMEFTKRSFSEGEKSRLYNQIRELYDMINLASLR